MRRVHEPHGVGQTHLQLAHVMRSTCCCKRGKQLVDRVSIDGRGRPNALVEICGNHGPDAVPRVQLQQQAPIDPRIHL